LNMADEGKVIVLKLTIDNKDYEAKIDVSKGQLVDLIKLIDPLEQKFEQAYKKITAELSKYTSANESSIQTLTQWLSQQNLSLSTIEKAIQKLQEETKAIDVNSAEWQKNMAALENLRTAHSKLIMNYDQQDKTQKQVLPGQQLMAMSMNQLGFAVGDASMIFTNFRMALMGVGNNIPFIIQYFNEAREAAGGTATTMQLLKGAIASGGGLIIGINALMLLMQVLPGLFDDTTEAVKEQEDEISKLAKEYENLSTTELKRQEAKLKLQLEEAEYQKKQIESRMIEFGTGGVDGQYTSTYKEFANKDDEKAFKKNEEETDKLNQKLQALTGTASQAATKVNAILTGTFDLSTINKVDDAIQTLNIEIKDIADDEKRNNLTKLRDEFQKLSDVMGGKDPEAKTTKKFVEEKSKALADLLAEEMKNQTEEELLAADYPQMLEMKEAAEIKLKESKDKIRSADNETALTAALAEKELIEDRIKIIEDAAEKYVNATEKEIEAVNKKKEADEREHEQFKKWQKEREKVLAEIETKTANDPFEQRKKELDVEEALSVQRAEKYGATEEQITNIHNWYTRQREQIDMHAWQNQLHAASQGLNGIAGLFNQHTLAYKTVKIAQAIIDTYSAANVALAAYPPPYNYIAVAGVIATGLENVKQITKTGTPKVGGYAEGGILPEGKAGIFEGTHKEIVAPEKDFIAVANELVARGQIAINALYTGSSGSGSNELLKELRLLNENLDKYSQRPAKAYITQDEFNKGYNEADYESRKSV